MSTFTDIPETHSLKKAFDSIGRSITAGLTSIARARGRMDEIEAFRAMSDEELAERGLTRDSIVQYVFRDKAVI